MVDGLNETSNNLCTCKKKFKLHDSLCKIWCFELQKDFLFHVLNLYYILMPVYNDNDILLVITAILWWFHVWDFVLVVTVIYIIIFSQMIFFFLFCNNKINLKKKKRNVCNNICHRYKEIGKKIILDQYHRSNKKSVNC